MLALASRRTLSFSTALFDAGSDLRYGFRPLPLYAYVAHRDGGRIVSFSQLSWIASGTMRGIWLAVCYFRLAHFSHRACAPFLLICPGERGLILAMAWLRHLFWCY